MLEAQASVAVRSDCSPPSPTFGGAAKLVNVRQSFCPALCCSLNPLLQVPTNQAPSVSVRAHVSSIPVYVPATSPLFHLIPCSACCTFCSPPDSAVGPACCFFGSCRFKRGTSSSSRVSLDFIGRKGRHNRSRFSKGL
jgi:hypothetical protein